MSPRTQQRAPKGRDRDRADRRAVVDVLLARLHRGVLTAAEAALLGEHVREEQRLADEGRRAMAGTTQALERHRAAADAEIRRLEGERDSLARSVESMHDGINATAREAFAQRRQHRDALAEQRARVDQVLGVLARVRRAQSLGDALAAVAEHDGLPPIAARMHARILDRADSTDARLAEQQRNHDIAIATVQARTRTVGATMQRTVNHHREAAKAAEQRLDAVRAALPTGPRPRLGVPTDLAYANGRHDLADAVREAMRGPDEPCRCGHPTPHRRAECRADAAPFTTPA
ncbi:hypothetical protein ACFWHG_09545 [Streptomyces microflavus]|uniref:hypothetical protein n=1 Tax=Streptomyces microflavus TaxID=1919 RepID=UPI00365ACF42